MDDAFYDALAADAAALVHNEPDVIANMANLSCLLYHSLNKRTGGAINWAGFYRVCGDATLVLGPFHGGWQPRRGCRSACVLTVLAEQVACLRIPAGKGVCGTAFARGDSVVVPDVDAFPGHIACDSSSKSEIVIVVRDALGHIIGVLDIDSRALNTFGPVDQVGLEHVVDVFAAPAPPVPLAGAVHHAVNH